MVEAYQGKLICSGASSRGAMLAMASNAVTGSGGVFWRFMTDPKSSVI